MPGMLIWYLCVFQALALNGMALALYFIALFTYPRHQSQPVIIWFKYETLSAHQLLYSNQSINQREICKAPLYETSRSANSSQWYARSALLILNAKVSINHCHFDNKHICFFLISIHIFLNTKRIVLQCNTSLTVFYLRQITEFKFSVQKTHNLHLDVYRALALNALAFALYFIALCIFALEKTVKG